MRRTALFLASLASGCAWLDPPPPVIRAEVISAVTPGQLDREAPLLTPAEREVRRVARIADAAVEGRVVRVRCARGAGQALLADVILPRAEPISGGALLVAERGVDGAYQLVRRLPGSAEALPASERLPVRGERLPACTPGIG